MIAWQQVDFRRTPVTLTVAAVAVALEIVSVIDPERREFFFTDARLGIGVDLWNGAIWQPLTTALLHANLLHAAFNVYMLLVFGTVLEQRLNAATSRSGEALYQSQISRSSILQFINTLYSYYRPLRFALLFLWLAYMCSLASFLVGNLFWTPRTPVYTGVGLSGVIYGLFAFLWTAGRGNADFRNVVPRDIVVILMGWFALGFVLTAASVMAIDNYAHAAGLLFGGAAGWACYGSRGRRAAQIALIVVTIVLLGSLYAAPGHPLYRAVERIRELKEPRTNGHGPVINSWCGHSTKANLHCALKLTSSFSPCQRAAFSPAKGLYPLCISTTDNRCNAAAAEKIMENETWTIF